MYDTAFTLCKIEVDWNAIIRNRILQRRSARETASTVLMLISSNVNGKMMRRQISTTLKLTRSRYHRRT